MKRIFLIGAPRSGTTMLQSLLASHPSIISFPETKFFHYLLYDQFSQSLSNRLEKFFVDELKRPELLNNWSDGQSNLDKAHCFIKILDELAEEQEKCIWLEKTPEHIYFIDYLENLLPDALFIHILRNGIDVIASMYEANRKSPEAWGGIWNLDFCIKRWQEAISISNQYVEKDNHFLIKYEQIVENPKSSLSKLCEFIQIDFDNLMLINYKETANKLSLEHPWHQGIDRDIQPSEIPKYQRIFKRDEIDYILHRINHATVGITHTVRVEVTEPISDICTPELTERLYCVIELEGTHLGTLELPVGDGLVAGHILKDAIATEFAWQILGRFFRNTVYCKSSGKNKDSASENLHDKIGWTVFLQDIWGRPDWPLDRFYDPNAVEETATKRIDDSWVAIEVSEELSHLELAVPELNVMLKVGGVALRVVTVAVEQNLVTAQALRAALTTASGIELCRACVREGLLGRALAEPKSLRVRLAQAAIATTDSRQGANQTSAPSLGTVNWKVFR